MLTQRLLFGASPPPAADNAAAQSAGPRRAARLDSLPGPPTESFHLRCNRLHAQRGSSGELLILFLCCSGMLRSRAVLTPALTAWQGGMCLLMLANIACRRARPESHVRWREAPTFLMRVFSLGEKSWPTCALMLEAPCAAPSCCTPNLGTNRHLPRPTSLPSGLGLGATLMQRLLANIPPPADDGGGDVSWAQLAAHAAHCLFISGGGHLAMFAVGWRVRLS